VIYVLKFSCCLAGHRDGFIESSRFIVKSHGANVVASADYTVRRALAVQVMRRDVLAEDWVSYGG
jgi:hypothetical protein